MRRFFVTLTLVALVATPVFAEHAWSNYHWARTSNPFTLKVYDNLTANWEPYLSEARNDWNKSTILDLNVIWQSPLSSAKRCTSATGVIEVCNAAYGQNGWLGIAGISVSGGHITSGYTKLNDSYFSMSAYNTPAWRRLVTCQEIGHDFGLGHQDENHSNANLGSCMDYSNDPDGGAGGAVSNDPSNEHPNAHDYDLIKQIYAHLDSTTTIAAMPIFASMAADATRPRTIDEIIRDADQWGTPVRFNREGRPTAFVMPVAVNSKGELEMEITHVFWVPEHPRDRGHEDH